MAATLAARWNNLTRGASSMLLASPLAAILLLFVVAPLLAVLTVSFFRYDNFAVIPAFILENYQSVLTSRLTLSLYLTMIKLAALTWACTLVIGCRLLPSVSRSQQADRHRAVPGVHRTVLDVKHHPDDLVAAVARQARCDQSSTDGDRSDRSAVAIPALLGFFGSRFLCSSVHHLHDRADIQMSRIDPALFEAALDAGAGRLRTMILVVLPLTKSGIVLGSVFVVTLVMGDFYVVKIMSGGGDASVVSAMVDDISTLLFPHAAASAVILLIVLSVVIAAIMRVVDVRRELVGDR